MNRNQRMIGNILFAFVVKGGSVIVGVLTIPAFMKYFADNMILGVWYTLLSLLTWVLNFDLGIGNGTRNLLVKQLVDRDSGQAKALVTSSYFAIGATTLVFALVGSGLIFVLSWNRVLNVSEMALPSDMLRGAVLIVFLGIVSQFFLKLVVSILNAMEKTAISSMLPLVSNVIILLYVLAARGGSQGERLVNLSWVYMLAVNVPYIVATVAVFASELKYALPSVRSYDRALGASVLKLGSRFFWVQIALMMVTVTNELLITHLFGAGSVVVFQIYNKVFYTAVTLFSLISNPIWSATASAYFEGRTQWIQKTYRWLGVCCLVACAGIALLAVFMQKIADVWLGPQTIPIDPLTCAYSAIYACIMVVAYAESSIANGMSRLKPQAVFFTVAAVLKIPLFVVIGRLTNRWDAIMLANLICMFPYIIVQHVAIQRDFRRMALEA